MTQPSKIPFAEILCGINSLIKTLKCIPVICRSLVLNCNMIALLLHRIVVLWKIC